MPEARHRWCAVLGGRPRVCAFRQAAPIEIKPQPPPTAGVLRPFAHSLGVVFGLSLLCVRPAFGPLGNAFGFFAGGFGLAFGFVPASSASCSPLPDVRQVQINLRADNLVQVFGITFSNHSSNTVRIMLGTTALLDVSKRPRAPRRRTMMHDRSGLKT